MKHPLTFALLVLLAITCAFPTLQAQPANDLFANRQTLTGTNALVAGNNFGAGSEPGEYTGTGVSGYFNSVWYTWTATASGVVHFSVDTTVPSFIPAVRTYRGETLTNLSHIGALPDGGIAVGSGDTIQIQLTSIYYLLWGGGGGKGAFTLNLWMDMPLPVSSNDHFANRLVITTPSYQFAGSIYGATTEPGEPPPPPGTSQTLWFGFTAPSSGTLTLNVSSPQFTPQIRFYEGTALSNLLFVQPVGGSGSSFSVASGHQYALQVASGFVPVGAVNLEARFQSIENDMFDGRLELEGTNFTIWCDNREATLEEGEQRPLASGAGASLWYSWVAPFSGRVTITSHSAYINRGFAVYTGPDLTHLQRLTAGQDSVTFMAIANTVYHLQADGATDRTGEFTFTLQAAAFQPATNDDFANAIVLKGTSSGGAYIGEATLEPGEPAHRNGAACKSLWWRWQLPGNATVVHVGNSGSLASNISFAVYTGDSVESLTPLGKGAVNQILSLGSVRGGTVINIAVTADPGSEGDVAFYCSAGSAGFYTPSFPVPGNLLCEPSLEGTGLELSCWHVAPSFGGFVGESGGADGATWITLHGGATMWQEFATIPDRLHEVRFAFRPEWGATSARVRMWWNGQDMDEGISPAEDGIYWHWTNYVATSTGTTSRITFEILEGIVSLDAFSVVPMTAPPNILTEPSSVSTFAGSSASFLVGAVGTPPLAYQWFFEGEPIPVETGNTLSLENASAADAGEYFVVVTNAFGAITSAPVTLVVETPTSPTIVLQPYGDVVALSGYFALSVAAVGTPPLHYQWYLGGAKIDGATNWQHVLAPVELEHKGTYTVKVWNGGETVWSLPATLKVDTNIVGGGAFWFDNDHIPDGGLMRSAPVTDVDGLTRLSGSNWLAQLYAGPSLELVRPAGQPRPFLTGFHAGLILPEAVVLPTVPPLTNAFVQMRVWEAAKGPSYEVARAVGGRFGKSEILHIVPGVMPHPPPLWGLQAFSLQAGLPQFATGSIRLLDRQPGGIVVWEHQGEPGFRYVVEKSVQGLEWEPYVVVTNTTATVTFTDSANSAAKVVFYRSRILD